MTDRSDAVSIERTFDAPPDLIWQMWTDPAHVAAWYCPDRASVEVLRMEVRVGGKRLVVMHVVDAVTCGSAVRELPDLSESVFPLVRGLWSPRSDLNDDLLITR